MTQSNAQVWRNKWAGRREPVNAFMQSAVRRLGPGRGRTLLDLGCGMGVDSMYASRRGFRVTAVDFSPSGIEALQHAAKQRTLKNIVPLLHDIARPLPFSNATFDVVYAHLSVHYFDDRTTRAVITEVHRVLRPGGFFFVKCKSINDPLYGKGECLGPDIYRSDHTRHFFSREYLRSLLEEFVILDLRSTSSTYHGKSSAFVQAVANKA